MTFLALWQIGRWYKVNVKNWKWKEIKHPLKWGWKIKIGKRYQRRMELCFQRAVLMWRGSNGWDLELSAVCVNKTERAELWPSLKGFTSVWKSKAWYVRSKVTEQIWVHDEQGPGLTWLPDSSVFQPAGREELPVITVYELHTHVLTSFSAWIANT